MKNVPRKNLGELHKGEFPEYKGDYPNGIDLKPGSSAHEKLRSMIMERAQESYEKVGSRVKSWRKIDRSLTAYVPLSEAEQVVKGRDSRKPVSVVVPISYATKQTLLTYWVAAFLSDVIFKFKGIGPEDTVGAMMLEKHIQLQAINAGMALNLYTWWGDGISYGFGALVPKWEKRRFKKTVRRKRTSEGNLGESVELAPSVTKEDVIEEGNVLYNIDPYRYLPDPNVPVYDVQRGQYVGWLDRSSYVDLLSKEKDSEGSIFNVKYLQKINGVSLFSTDRSGRKDRDTSGSSLSTKGAYPTLDEGRITRPVDTIYMSANIIPKDWDLSNEEYPEKWIFALSGDEVITMAEPLGLDHQLHPVAVVSPDFDGHSLFSTSKLEVIYPMQEWMDWLLSSRVANVRKSVNDMLIYDPSLVNSNDIKNPGPGKLIRLRRAAWGIKDVRSVIHQLDVNDVTKGNIADMSFIMDIIQRVTAATDPIQGMMRKGSERRSAAEYRGTESNVFSRIGGTAMLTWYQGMLPLAKMLAMQTQQFVSQDSYFEVVGETQKRMLSDMKIKVENERATITPEGLTVGVDVVPHDGSVPGVGDPAVWSDIFRVASTSPVLQQNVDITRIFKHLARISGAKNIDEFMLKEEVQPRVVADEEVEQEVGAGNLVPLEEI